MTAADRPAARPPSPASPAMSPLAWRTSSFSDRGNCVAVAHLGDGSVGVRNSNRPEAGTLAFPPGSNG